MTPVKQLRFRLLALAAASTLCAVTASADVYFGFGLGVAFGIENADAGGSAISNVGYDWTLDDNAQHSLGIELVTSSQVFETDFNDDLTIAAGMIGARYTYFFQSQAEEAGGWYGTAAAAIGGAVIDRDFDNSRLEFEDDEVAIGQLELRVGYAFNEHSRLSFGGRYIGIDDAEDETDGTEFLEGGGFGALEIAYSFHF